MLEYKTEDTKERVNVSLSGNATVENGDELKTMFVEVLQKGKDILVDTRNLDRFDLCLVQSCLAAKKSAEAQGFEVAWEGEDLTEYMARIGYSGPGKSE